MTNLPLSGKHILVTRPKRQAEAFAEKIAAAGGKAHIVPLIAFRPFQNAGEKEYIHKLFTYDWIILTSKNAVDYFFQRLKADQVDVGLLRARFAVIGTKTARALEEYGFEAAFMPAVFSADDFVEETKAGGFTADHVLIPKGNLARDIIAKTLRQRGADVDEWIIYETFFPEEAREALLPLLDEGKLDVITFTSPSGILHFSSLVREADIAVSAKIACIGAVTEKAALQQGFEVDICPEEYTMESLVEEICNYYRKV